ncbi:MAG: hypothetical protein QF682_00960 [Candidatus Thermoplasmatota archaeon]|nr:hypothetical protein [Candidatus Thermoplasmatota archaeon]
MLFTKAINMISTIVPSDSYVRYLSLPSLQPAPDHVKNLFPDYQITHIWV